jgi:hypothetical protein
MIEQIEFFLPIFSCGNLFFSYLTNNNDYTKITLITWISLGVGVLHAMLPMQEINKLIFKI